LLFKLGPKTRREDFYNFDSELNKIINDIMDPTTRLIAVKGLRRTGKSSLVRVAVNQTRYPFAIIDLREFAQITPTEFVSSLNEILLRSYERLSKRYKIPIDLERISVFGVSFTKRERKIYRQILREINDVAMRKKTRFILIIDEAQEAVRFGFDRYLAFVYDNLEGILTIVTGSQVGVFENMLENSESPLFGRAYSEITMRRLKKEEAMEFLRLGFEELSIKVEQSLIEQIVDELDGIIGWLSYYGWQFYKTKNHKKALQKARRGAILIAKKEIENFLQTRGIGRRQYLLVLKALSTEPMRWSDIKRYLEIKMKREIPNNQVTKYIKTLLDYGFIIKERNKYKIPDPITKKAVREITTS